eukprot:scaffold66659_cov72-Phaeocystis_antarctica.AAC.2
MQLASSRRPCTAWHSYTAIQRYTLYTHTALYSIHAIHHPSGFGWPRLILSDDSERGGKLATFVLYMAEDTDLVGASISNYVWAFRSWLKFQRQLDPIYGVVDWEDFMQGVAVRTWVPAEPRKKAELWWIRGALRR